MSDQVFFNLITVLLLFGVVGGLIFIAKGIRQYKMAWFKYEFECDEKDLPSILRKQAD